MNNYAQLKANSPFYPLFPHGRVPVLNILVPRLAECQGDGVREVYMVDLDKFSNEQFEAVVRLVVQQCDPGSSLERAKAEIIRHGLPLRAKHVASVVSDNPFFL